jgi:UDP-2,4-diacetamido-2,4,6-trideoxy-beta-L-altropyranose hydrolase
MQTVIRADGGPDIGYGHLVRTGALAEELLGRGHDVTYATVTPDAVREVCPGSVGTVSLSSKTDSNEFVEELQSLPDLAVLDSYHADGQYQRRVRRQVPLAVVSDDTRHSVCADVLVNGNLYASELDYETIGDAPRWCLGASYLMLRREIADLISSDPPFRSTPRRALVTMGGSDMADATPTVVRAFDGLAVQVDVIVGPGFSQEQEMRIRDTARAIDTPTTVVRDPNDLPRRMFDSDFAVCTASSTTYELLGLGTPITCLPIAENQMPIADELGNRDLATVLPSDADEAAFRRGLERYLSNASLRRRRRDEGRNIVDGRGTERVADVLQDSVRS